MPFVTLRKQSVKVLWIFSCMNHFSIVVSHRDKVRKSINYVDLPNFFVVNLITNALSVGVFKMNLFHFKKACFEYRTEAFCWLDLNVGARYYGFISFKFTAWIFSCCFDSISYYSLVNKTRWSFWLVISLIMLIFAK